MHTEYDYSIILTRNNNITRDTLKCRVFLAQLQVYYYVNYHMNVEVRRHIFIHVTKRNHCTIQIEWARESAS